MRTGGFPATGGPENGKERTRGILNGTSAPTTDRKAFVAGAAFQVGRKQQGLSQVRRHGQSRYQNTAPAKPPLCGQTTINPGSNGCGVLSWPHCMRSRRALQRLEPGRCTAGTIDVIPVMLISSCSRTGLEVSVDKRLLRPLERGEVRRTWVILAAIFGCIRS